MHGRGPAWEMYENSRAKTLMSHICKQSLESKEMSTAESMSLAYAIYGGSYVQCEKCWRYLKPDRVKNHTAKDCTNASLRFPKAKNRWFCMLGCEVFLKRNDLLNHLSKHTRSSLKKWGFSKTMIKE